MSANRPDYPAEPRERIARLAALERNVSEEQQQMDTDRPRWTQIPLAFTYAKHGAFSYLLPDGFK